MSSIGVAPPARLRCGGSTGVLEHAAWLGRRGGVGVAVAALVAVAAFLRTRELSAPFWIDEGIAVGIAHHGVLGILHVLREDGAPPLYYLLLHGWIGVLGDSERAVHALSALFAVLAVPAAWWAASAVTGRRGALLAAALAAFNPFVGLYADEGRMYSLVLLLSVVATGAFVRAFLLGHRRQVVVFAVTLTALLYTHNWAVFFGAASGIAMLACAWARSSRRTLVDGVLAFAAAGIALGPWLPTVAFQAAHTGAPWAHRPNGDSLRRAVQHVLGGSTPLALLCVVALGGLGALVGPRVRAPGAPRVLAGGLAALGIAAGTLVLAWGYSRLGTPAWALRYLVIALGPFLLALAAGLEAAGLAGVLAVAVVCGSFWWGKPTTTSLIRKSNAEQVVARLAPELQPGAVLLSMQPEEVPVLRYYLGPAPVAYRDPTGAVPDPQVTNWVDALPRLRAARYWRDLRPVVRSLRPGQQLLVVTPHFGRPDAPWTKRIRTLGRQWHRALQAEPGLRRVARVVPPAHGENRVALGAVLYVRRPL